MIALNDPWSGDQLSLRYGHPHRARLRPWGQLYLTPSDSATPDEDSIRTLNAAFRMFLHDAASLLTST
ncbi:hypothetical protein [Deinococcus apachensis]|uniref:hypothetical protein n=1 Tax=Deinococcus apachensis TaxID=309886 RepID=UPI00037D9C24|nr:hypothetical protein [Deinococcus apachensis]